MRTCLKQLREFREGVTYCLSWFRVMCSLKQSSSPPRPNTVAQSHNAPHNNPTFKKRPSRTSALDLRWAAEESKAASTYPLFWSPHIHYQRLWALAGRIPKHQFSRNETWAHHKETPGFHFPLLIIQETNHKAHASQPPKQQLEHAH